MNRIREVRKEVGISQAALCRRLSWGQSRLANYELGIRKPGIEEARAVIRALRSFGAKCSMTSVFPPVPSTKTIA